MAGKAPSPSNLNTSNPNVGPPPPSSHPGSVTNAPFTPRSTTFPDDLGSDTELDGFDPTPMHSPDGPHYDDLPPSYDEAQQQALRDARAGRPPLNPNDLEVQRMVLNDTEHPPPPSAQPQRLTSSLLSNPHAYEFEPENRRNADGLGMSVPVQQVRGSEQIPIGQSGQGNRSASDNAPSDPTAELLSRALDFTRHTPDADVRYAPRLTRSVAIPQTNRRHSSHGTHRGGGRHHECGRRGRGRGRGGHGHPMPGQWPEAASSETISSSASVAEEPSEFLRAYAKSLHAHDVRPAEFIAFLDGLNALCLAMNVTPIDLIDADAEVYGPASIVRGYINGANEAFFAPRGLRVSLQSLSSLLDALKIPSERGQRAGAEASVLDDKASPAQRAQALHPWIEALETNVPSASTQTTLLREMCERYRRLSQSESQHSSSADMNRGDRKAEGGDPQHSVPEPNPGQNNHGFPPFPPFGHQHGPRGHARGPGRFAWGPPPHYGAHYGARRGRGGYGWGPGPRGFGPGHGQSPNQWAALGENFGKWGEEFGKRMEEWGQQFGQRAESWGTDFGRQAEAFGAGVAARASGNPTSNAQARGEGSNQAFAGPATAASPGPDFHAGQETGVLREDSSSAVNINEKGKVEERGKKHKVAEKDNDDDDDDDDDDDASSISSSSSSESSDSEDEDDFPDTQALFLSRIRSINAVAESSRAKGKKSDEEINRERDAAIEKATAQRNALDLKIQQKREKKALKKELRRKKREIEREHRKVRRELKGLGKEGKKEIKERKKEHRKVKKEVRREIREARRGWKDAGRELRAAKREKRRGRFESEGERGADMVWIVVENLE